MPLVAPCKISMMLLCVDMRRMNLTLCTGLQDTCSVPEVEAELERFGQYIGKMLLFLRSLRVVRVLTWAMGAMTSQQAFRVSKCADWNVPWQWTLCPVVPICQLLHLLAAADPPLPCPKQTWTLTFCGSPAVQQSIRYPQQWICVVHSLLPRHSM